MTKTTKTTKTRFTAAHVALTAAMSLAGCMTDLDVRTEFDVEHDEAFVKEGEDLHGAMHEMDDGFFATDLIAASGHTYQRVGLRFDTASDVELFGRAGPDLSNMSPWVPVTVTFSEGMARNGHFDIDEAFYGAPFIQLKASDAAVLSFMAVSPIELSEADSQGGLEVADDDDGAMQALVADGIAIQRSAWGARNRTCSSRHTPSRLTIHQTETPNNDSLSMAARVRQIQAYHIDNKGWCDIGYHFLIGQDGRVYQGRYENRVGAHAAGANTDNVGISFIGSFSGRAPSGDMMAAGARIMRALADTYGIPLDRTRVKGHREVGTTETDCPGTALYARLQSLIDLARQSSTLQPPPGQRPSEPSQGRSCFSTTLGRQVNDGDAIQVNYAGCGADSCGWYTCSDTAWVCGQGTEGTAARTPHAACTAPDIEPAPPTSPDVPPTPTGDEAVIVVENLPFTHSADTRALRRSNMSQYSCDAGQREGGKEAIYQVTLPVAGTLSAAVDDVPGDDVDVDVHLLQRLDATTCLDRDNIGIVRSVVAGTFFVVVDSWTTSTGVHKEGPYTLRLSFTPAATTPPDVVVPPTTPPTTDACPADVDCLQTANQRLSGTTSGGSRRFDRFSCSEADVSGPERVYRVVVEEDGFFSARVSGGSDGTDVDVHVLSNLSEDACLDRGDTSAGAFIAAGEVFVVVDTYVPGNGADLSGGYTLDLHHTSIDDLVAHGLTQTVARRALRAFDNAWRLDATEKLTYTIIDFDQRSSARRLWSIDLATGARLQHLHVSHGIGSNHSSDPARAVRFSNVSGSNQSSLGLSRGAETYSGNHGRSLRLDGLEPGFNSNMRDRAVVVHAADYAAASFANSNGYLGRSQGCPAVDPARSNALIDVIRDGGLLFSHFSDPTWLAQSRFLR